MFLVSLTAVGAFHRQLELNASAAARSSKRQLQVGAVSPLPQPCSHHPNCSQSLAARGHPRCRNPTEQLDGQTDHQTAAAEHPGGQQQEGDVLEPISQTGTAVTHP